MSEKNLDNNNLNNNNLDNNNLGNNMEKETLHKIPDYDYLKIASMQDCTGLIPAGPVDEKEMADYEELYPFLPPTISEKSSIEVQEK